MTSVLYLFGSAAPPVFDLPDVVRRARSDGWDVCVGLTPTAADWLRDRCTALEELTGHPVRSQYKRPGAADVWPKADAIVFAPLTMNSVNAWALGLTSSFVIGVVAEGIGKRIPTVGMPCVNAAYAQHPQFERSVETLRSAGVRMLYGDGGFVPNQPGEKRPYPWDRALDEARRLRS
ncbi:flavoprotein [Streptomyces sp. NPDC018031]|uniref:flavoprotein n=1 Tax=Streptomyces sp. NPDC018031 TaxID=3365033 RepID=UPI003790932F